MRFCLDMLGVCCIEILLPIKTLSLPESVTKTGTVVLTFHSVDEILWCDHSNETSFGITFATYHLFFSTLQNESWEFF